MIKQLSFVSRRAQISAADFGAAWVAACARIQAAPANVRPLRAVVCTTAHGVPGTDAPHDGLYIDWFDDIEALRRFDAWLGPQAPGVVDPGRTLQILVEEAVLRGADWLAQHRTDGALKHMHMALARRAIGLTPSQFSARWRNRAGRIGGSGVTTPIAIPEAARGRAYIQNHPLASAEREAGYDAINEVYFDDLESMRARLDFFRDNDPRRADADLVNAAHFMVVTERAVL
jgi:hypothetical protein